MLTNVQDPTSDKRRHVFCDIRLMFQMILLYLFTCNVTLYYARVVLVGHNIVVPNKSYLILSYLTDTTDETAESQDMSGSDNAENFIILTLHMYCLIKAMVV